MAGIELFLPVLKTGSTNMQMVFDKNNGMSLGALVEGGSNKDGETSLTSYEVDATESISPLGVSLKWNNVNMKTHVVRGMPYGTVRFGKNGSGKKKGSFVLPTITAGNRPKSILIDSDSKFSSSNDPTEAIESAEEDTSSKITNEMLCGTFTGEAVEQDPSRAAPITSSGKPKEYTVQNEVVIHMDQSDFTWVVFFSKPVKIQCWSDVVPMVSVAGTNSEVQFRLDVTEVTSGDKDDDEDELVVRMALLNECTTGKGIIQEHCDHLSLLGYDTVSSKEMSQEYLTALRKGKNLYAKSPLVGTEFPKDDEETEERVTNVVFDWDATSVNVEKHEKAAASVSSVAASSLRTSSAISNSNKPKVEDEGSFIMFALPHHLQTLVQSDPAAASSDLSSPMCIHTFHGRTCLVEGPVWNLPVSHGKPQSFLADRPPLAKAIPAIAEAAKQDIQFELSPNVLRGAADTYFLVSTVVILFLFYRSIIRLTFDSTCLLSQAKILAKVGRVIEISKELQNLQSGDNADSYSDADESTVEESAAAASKASLPSDDDIESKIDDLQAAVEIWLKPGGAENGGGEAEFLYDESWGGFVNCGCNYTFEKEHAGEGSCSNSFPECPAIDDVNVDFGNGW